MLTKAEMNSLILDSMQRQSYENKSLTDNLAEKYLDWLHSVIMQAQQKLMEPLQQQQQPKEASK